MKVAFFVVTFLTIFLLTTSGHGQSTRSFQDVSNDFETEWVSKLMANNLQSAQQNLKNDLWTWGSAPKGSMIVNGMLAPDPYYIWKSLNYTQGWLGKAYVDPITGYPVYAYIDPYTGRILNFYVDPTTGSPVYTNVDSNAEVPYYEAVPSYRSGNYVLPSVFDSNNPWG
ncbi:MAG: hypothetical protein MUO26_05980 [Methanotrichaceae archaeon]|nr:hypothetical protein [Methanotrichaceae archaeon]